MVGAPCQRGLQRARHRQIGSLALAGLSAALDARSARLDNYDLPLALVRVRSHPARHVMVYSASDHVGDSPRYHVGRHTSAASPVRIAWHSPVPRLRFPFPLSVWSAWRPGYSWAR